ncbi:MAG: 30S ribosomal protein S6 [Chloroflexota bacterium]
MREYEVTVILQSKLEEPQRNQLIEAVSELLVPGAGEDEKPKVDVWGRRKMAYPIRKQTEGFYVLYHASMDPARIDDIERSMQYNEDILRYLVIRKPE